MDEVERRLAPLGLARAEEVAMARIAARLADLPPICAELCGGSLRAWAPFTKLFTAEVAGAPALVSTYDGTASLWGPPLLAPLDPALPAAFAEAFDLLDAANRALLQPVESSRCLYVPRAWTVNIVHHPFTLMTQGHEYLYARDALATLSGGARKRRRAEAHAFERACDPCVESYTFQAREACARLLARWRTETPAGDAEAERKKSLEADAVACMLERAADGHLRGIVVRVGDEVVAFSLADDVGAAGPRREVAILAEKTARGFPGLSSFVFREAAARLAPAGSVVNAGEDWDLLGLAAAKRAFGPEEIRETCEVRRRRE